MVSDIPEQGVRVVVADDHVPMRGQIRRTLEAGGCDVVAECGTAREAVRLAVLHEPDVVLLDIHMPGSGIRAAQELTRLLPGTAVVMLTQSQQDDDLFDSLRAGAAGYLLKDTPPERLVPALRGVLAGEAAMSPRLVARIMDEFRAPRRWLSRRSAAAGRLSSREWEVMDLLGRGLTTDEVAQRLFLSPTTVRVHVSSVLRKLRVKDRQSALTMLRGE